MGFSFYLIPYTIKAVMEQIVFYVFIKVNRNKDKDNWQPENKMRFETSRLCVELPGVLMNQSKKINFRKFIIDNSIRFIY